MRARLGWLPVLLALALIRGGLYASALPPWGLIDEEQHVDYIHTWLTYGTPPRLGEAYLSHVIAVSVFETRRWETLFHIPGYASVDPHTWGLEGWSYQGYHPPLYYALLAPVYALAPDPILLKVQLLRWATVGLSLVSVALLYGLASELLPSGRAGAALTALVLISLPERTFAVSRVNNDSLLELCALAFVWVLIRSLAHGLTRRRAQLLGLLLGLGFLAKTSMLVLAVGLVPLWWLNRRTPAVLGWTAGIAAGLAGPWVARNLALYGDFTGFAGFQQLAHFAPRALDAPALWAAVTQAWTGTWIVWWVGADAGWTRGLTVFHGLFLGLAAASGWGWWRALQRGTVGRPLVIPLTLLLIVLTTYGAMLASYVAGQVPVPQGRLILPALGALLALLVWGWELAGRRAVWGGAAVVLLLGIDANYLFVHLLVEMYYWSGFVYQPYTPQPWPAAWALFLERFQHDKPAGWLAVNFGLFSLYAASLSAAGWWTARRLWRARRA